jgi:hypothetical protein
MMGGFSSPLESISKLDSSPKLDSNEKEISRRGKDSMAPSASSNSNI